MKNIMKIITEKDIGLSIEEDSNLFIVIACADYEGGDTDSIDTFNNINDAYDYIRKIDNTLYDYYVIKGIKFE